jgi:hypothetical protein
MTDNQDLISQRYGRKPSNKKALFIAGAALLSIFLIWAIWVVIAGTQPTAKTLAYEVKANNQVSISFSISKPKESSISCAVQALKQDFGIVGYTEVHYPAGSDYLTDTVTLTTTEPAVTGLVDHCWFD